MLQVLLAGIGKEGAGGPRRRWRTTLAMHVPGEALDALQALFPQISDLAGQVTSSKLEHETNTST
jgi:hypothetical protein